jgi:hypothetical protein
VLNPACDRRGLEHYRLASVHGRHVHRKHLCADNWRGHSDTWAGLIRALGDLLLPLHSVWHDALRGLHTGLVGNGCRAHHDIAAGYFVFEDG